MRRTGRPSRSFAFLIAGALAATSAARADDWLRFRGPNGSGTSDTAFSQPITEADFLWKVALPGVGHSSPVIRGDRVYLTCADRESARRVVLCLGAVDGKTIWQREFASKTFKQHNDNSYASATPALDDTGVYVAYTTPDDYTLLALDHAGKERWKASLGRYLSQHGSGVSPVVVGDVVILTNDQEGPRSSVVAVERQTGKVRWQIDRKSGNKMAASTPCLFQPKTGPAQLILTCKATGMTSLDPQTGAVNWEVPDAFVARTVASPVAGDDLVVGTCGEGAAERHLIAVRPGPGPTDAPTVAYKIDGRAPYVPTPLIHGERMYLWGDGGVVSCVRTATGEEVWSEKVGGQFYGSPVLAGDTIWCMSRRGELVGVGAGDTFKLVGRLDLGEASHATPAIAGGRMYLRTLSHVICVGKK